MLTRLRGTTSARLTRVRPGAAASLYLLTGGVMRRRLDFGGEIGETGDESCVAAGANSGAGLRFLLGEVGGVDCGRVAGRAAGSGSAATSSSDLERGEGMGSRVSLLETESSRSSGGRRECGRYTDGGCGRGRSLDGLSLV